MWRERIKNAKLISVRAKKAIAGEFVPEVYAKGDVISYYFRIDHSFYNENGIFVLYLKTDIQQSDWKNFAKGECVKVPGTMFRLTDDIKNENDLAQKLVEHVDDKYFRQMKSGKMKLDFSKLLFLDREKLSELGCNDERLITTGVEITFGHLS